MFGVLAFKFEKLSTIKTSIDKGNKGSYNKAMKDLVIYIHYCIMFFKLLQVFSKKIIFNKKE